MSHVSTGRERLRGLDGLRALAVIGVLAFHDGRLSGGFLGVDLFFALSGFLITTLIIAELDRTDRLDLIGFWGRRLRRLLPAVMVLLVVVVVTLRSIAEPGEWIIARHDAPWAQFYAANWHQIAVGNGYWDAFAAPSAFEHLWSLAIEEQFYLMWPVVVWAAWRWRRRAAVAATTVSLFVASSVAMILLFDGGDPTRVYMGTDTRAFSLLAGAMAALPAVRDRVARLATRTRRSVELVTTILLSTLLASWFVIDGSDDWLFRGGLVGHSIIAALVAVSVPASNGLLTTLLSVRPLEYVGRLSYALYLWHWPIFVFCSPERMDTDGWRLTLVRSSSTLLFSMASYHLVEQTIRHRARWAHGGAGRRAFAASMVGAVIVWLVVTVPATTNAVDEDAITGAIATTTSAPTTSAPDSANESTTTTTTLAPDLGPPVRSIYYLGDSVAYDMWPGVEAAMRASGLEARSGAFGGVGLIPEGPGPTPIEMLGLTLDEVRPDLLILQLSVWDAKQSEESQRAALEELRLLAVERDQRVLLLSFPTFSPERTESGQEALERIAMSTAAATPELFRYADQTSALGEVFDVDIDDDDNPERKRDGIHVCPTGAIRSAQWLVSFLAENYSGVTAPVSNDWILGTWWTDARYDSPPGACARL